MESKNPPDEDRKRDGRLSICFVAYAPPFASGGASTHFWELLKHLPSFLFAEGKEGRICVVMEDIPHPEIKGVEFHVVKGNYLPSYRKRTSARIHRFLLSLRLVFLAKKDCKNADIIYSRSLINAFFLLFLWPDKRKNLVLEANGIWSEEHLSRKGGKKDLTYILLRWMEKKVAGSSAGIICVTPQIAEFYGRYNSNVFVVHNGVDTTLFRPLSMEDRLYMKKSFGLNGFPVVGFVGNFAPWQGLELIVPMARIVVEHYPDVRFLLVGDGEVKENLEREVAEAGLEKHFIFAGHVDYEKVPMYINAMDVCVAPFWKGKMVGGVSALKLYEYMACGRPIVVSAVPNTEFINKVRCGLRFSPGNPDDFARKVLHLLEHKKEAEEMGQAGRKFVEIEGSWKKVAEKTSEIFYKINAKET